MRVGSRKLRRRVRCVRRGHYWIRRMDSAGNVETVCGRCGRPDTREPVLGRHASFRGGLSR